MSSDAAKAILTDSNSVTTAIATILEDTFPLDQLYGMAGDEGMDIDTIVDALQSRFGGTIPQAVRNRIQAVCVLRETDSIENDVAAFNGFVLACVDGHLGDLVNGMLEEVSIEEASWGLFEAVCIDPEMEGLSPAVVRFIAQLPEEGEEVFDRRLETWIRQLSELGIDPSTVAALTDRGSKALEYVTKSYEAMQQAAEGG